jgi:hypothetical protein
LTERIGSSRRKNKRKRKGQDLVDWRRSYVVEQTSKGKTQAEIARILQVGIGTVNRDLDWFRNRIKEKMTKVFEKIQEEHEKSIIGLNSTLNEAWAIVENAKDNKEKLQALSLAKDCYDLREELLCNMPIIDEALKFESESESEERKPESVSEPESESFTGGTTSSPCRGEKEEDDIQRSEEKDRESQNRKTTNKTF